MPANTGTTAERPPALVACAEIAGLALVRRLGKLRIPVGVLDTRAQAPAIASRYTRHAWIDASGDSESILSRMEQAAGHLGGRPVLIATSDDFLLLISRHRDRLALRFRMRLADSRLLEDLVDKRRMTALLERHGIAVPRTRMIENRRDLRDAAMAFGFPCLLKAACGKVSGSQEPGKLRVHSLSELEAAWDRIAASDPRLMVQEYLSGSCEQIGLYNAYFNRNSEPVAVFTGRKLRQYPVEFGTACLSECGSHPEIAPPLTRFFETVGYCGPVDVGLKWDARTGVFKVLDINPRLGQNYRAYVSSDGSDLGWLHYRELSGEDLPCRRTLANPLKTRYWAIEDSDWRCFRQLHAEGRLPLLRWLRSCWQTHEFAYWDWSDPQPFLQRIRRQPATPATPFQLKASEVPGDTYARIPR